MHSDLVNEQVQTFLLRFFHAGLILVVAVYLHKSARALDDPALKTRFWNISRYVGLFFIFGIIAGILDIVFMLTIGWFSHFVNAVFWGDLIRRARRLYIILSSPRNAEVRISLRADIDQLTARLLSARANARKLLPH